MLVEFTFQQFRYFLKIKCVKIKREIGSECRSVQNDTFIFRKFEFLADGFDLRIGRLKKNRNAGRIAFDD